MKKTLLSFSIGITAVSVLLIILLATGFWKRFFNKNTYENITTMVITPNDANSFSSFDGTGQMRWNDSLNTKIQMKDGETVIALINREREEGLAEEQFVAFIDSASPEKRVHIAYINFDENSRSYKRQWDAQTVITHPETLSFYDQDIIGDRNNCIIVTGMNTHYEHAMAVFRPASAERSFDKIAELQIDGSIVIQEATRSFAYQQGLSNGQSYNIATYGHDSFSNNILDQIETIYSFNPHAGHFEMLSISRIPGSQIEQQQLRKILSGESGVFESFINDLWYYVSSQGTIDLRQYIYFNPNSREIIFYGDEAQQVFLWQNSVPTRYGLYITSQNISISTLRRRIDIEMESLDSIKLRVSEDVRIKIEVSESWDGSYRRAGSTPHNESASSIMPLINALYDSSWGRIQFEKNGEFAVSSGNTINKGRYIFYTIGGQQLLELRSYHKNEDLNNSQSNNRMIYRIEIAVDNSMNLSHIRLGTSGIQELFEPAIIFTPVTN
jgi:WD40 repeat protein